MRKLFKIEFIGSLASIVALGFFVYYQFIFEAEAVLELTTLNKEELTRIPTDNSLQVQYSFNGESVTNLWKVKIEIRNVGGKTIIGKENVGIIIDPLPLKFNESNQIFGVEISNKNFPIQLLKVDSLNFGLSFKQWKNNEFLELSAYIGNDGLSNIEGITVDERDIIDGKVILSELKNTEIAIEPRIIDKLPISIKKTAWWLMIIGYLFYFVTSIWESRKQLKSEEIQSSKWATMTFLVLMLIIMIAIFTPLLWIIEA